MTDGTASPYPESTPQSYFEAAAQQAQMGTSFNEYLQSLRVFQGEAKAEKGFTDEQKEEYRIKVQKVFENWTDHDLHGLTIDITSIMYERDPVGTIKLIQIINNHFVHHLSKEVGINPGIKVHFL